MPPGKESRLPKLPSLVEQKITKTGYTRGATNREIFQNRVTRNNTVLIDRRYWAQCAPPNDDTELYENGFIVLIEPSWYFGTLDSDERLGGDGLALGVNALLLFRRRADWLEYRPRSGRLENGQVFKVAEARTNPLGGVYFARIHATVSDKGGQLVEGFNSTKMRGAGIRVYEYASSRTIAQAKVQLEALMWLCHDAKTTIMSVGMSANEVERRKAALLKAANEQGLLDGSRLRALRILSETDETICPLCLERISITDFLKRGDQAEGRETYDRTITEVSLFHIQELRIGKLQHKPYNLGWGHHFCNVVAKDAGILPTLKWMKRVLDNQGSATEHLAALEESVEDAVYR